MAVAAKKLHKAGLGACGALAAQQREGLDSVFNFLKIHIQLVKPQGGALADRGQLRGLEVCVGQRGHTLVFIREARQQVHDVQKLPAYDLEPLLHNDDVGIVAHVATCRPQVDDALRARALEAVGVDVAHHIMAAFALAALGVLVIDVVPVGSELGDLLVGDGQALPFFGSRQGNPQPAPGAEFVILRKGKLHLRAGIAGGKGADVSGMVGHGENLLKRFKRGECW